MFYEFYDKMQGNKNGVVRGTTTNGGNGGEEATAVETTLAESKAAAEEEAPLNGAGKGKADVVVVTSKGSGTNNGGTSTKVSTVIHSLVLLTSVFMVNLVISASSSPLPPSGSISLSLS